MRNLVRRIPVKVVCDTYSCRNMAEFEVGHVLTPAVATHYCKDCMNTIFEEARDIILEVYKEEKKNKQENFEPTTKSATETCVSVEEAEEENVEIAVAEPDSVEPETEETKEQDVYTCKHCGETFKRPDELSNYRKHIAKCGK